MWFLQLLVFGVGASIVIGGGYLLGFRPEGNIITNLIIGTVIVWIAFQIIDALRQ